MQPGSVMRRCAAVLLIALSVVVGPSPTAHAAGSVTVANDSGEAKVDPTYATTLKVRGSGFQSIKGGHGGIYVVFGTVSTGWRPSQGGATGKDYFYVPDSEAANNQGFQRYVAFPGSDTAGSANGGVIAANGTWSTQIVVPGATFQALDRNGGTRTVDCRKVTCGVITFGAHGVVNGRNESFTPVTFADLYGAQTPAATPSTPLASEQPATDGAGAGETGTDTGADTGTAEANQAPSVATPGKAAGPASLEVDRQSAKAGNVLAFTASGLPAGSQISAVLDDGVAAAGPFMVGADGQVAGVVTIPAEATPGTHELRLFGIENPPSVRFAVAAATEESTEQIEATPVASEVEGIDRRAVVFVSLAGAVLLMAIALRLTILRRKEIRSEN